jgi:hypothetical protein
MFSSSDPKSNPSGSSSSNLTKTRGDKSATSSTTPHRALLSELENSKGMKRKYSLSLVEDLHSERIAQCRPLSVEFFNVGEVIAVELLVSRCREICMNVDASPPFVDGGMYLQF